MMLTHSNGNTEACILRLYTAYETPDVWCYEDLYLSPEALAPVKDMADELGIEHDSFGPGVIGEKFSFNDVESGQAYVIRAAERHWAVCSNVSPALLEGRKSLPPPKGLAA